MSSSAPWRQTNWDWRAAANFMGGGAGAGLLVAAAILSAPGDAFRPYAAIALLLIGGGLLSAWLEIGRPLRAMNVFLHPQTSWMTRESYVAVALLAVGLLTVLVAPRSKALPEGGALIWASAVLAAVYLFTQTRMLAGAKGIPAWREPALQPLMVVTGLTEGVGLMLALAPVAAGSTARPAAVLLGLCVLRGVAWLVYLRRIESGGVPRAARAAVRRASTGFIVLGHVLPIALLILALRPWPWSTGLAVLAGVVALAAGWLLKYLVITRAAYNQGFALPWTPVRGAGDAVAGPRPGWSTGGEKPLVRRAPAPLDGSDRESTI